MAVISLKAKNIQTNGDVSLVQFGLTLTPGEEQELLGLATLDTIFKSVELARLLKATSISVRITRDDGSIRFADSDGFTFASEERLGDDNSGPAPHKPLTLDLANSNGLVLDFPNQVLGLNPASPSAPGSMHASDRSWLLGMQAQNVLYVNKTGPYGPNQFSSFSAAIAAATALSPSDDNRVVIQAAPGLYIEPALVVPMFVFVNGLEMDAVIVQPDSATHHIFQLSANSGLNFLTLRNAGTGFAGIYCPDVGVFTEIHKVTIFDCDIGIWCTAVTKDCQNYFEYVDTNGGTIGIKVEAFNGHSNFVNVENFYVFAGLTSNINPTYGAYLSGPGVDFEAQAVGFDGTSNTGTAIQVVNGAFIDLKDTTIKNWAVGFNVPSDGGSPLIRLMAVPFNDNVLDIQIANTNTTGTIISVTNEEMRTSVVAGADVAFLFLDPDDGNIVTSGVIKTRQNDNTFADITTLISQSGTMGVLTGGVLTAGSGRTLNVSGGTGYCEATDGSLKRFDWSNTSIVIPALTDSYVYFDETGLLTANVVFPNTENVILLGRVVTTATAIDFVDSSGIVGEHSANLFDLLFRDGLGPIYAEGSIVSKFNNFGLSVTPGEYFLATNVYTPVGGTGISWTAYYGDGSGGQNRVSQSLVDGANYDPGTGSLAPIGSVSGVGNYVKHAIYICNDEVNEKYMLVYGQVQFSALTLAEQGNIPTPPAFFTDGVALIASVIVQAGASSIVEIRDQRPRIGFTSSGVAAATFHGNLLGLANDDHKQYLLVNGTRAMAGNLNMGLFAITNAGQYNGVTVEAHEARHLPGGADPITTGTPVTLNPDQANAPGVANALVRSDHIHNVPTAAAVTQNPDQSNAVGSSTSFSRADHIHNIPTATAVGLNANSTSTQGSTTNFSRADHTHAIASGVVSTQTPDQSNAAGSSANFARADHVHNIPTAAAVTQGPDNANADGSAATFARSDHIHNIPTALVVNIGVANSQGSSTSFARSDHVHQGIHSLRVNNTTQRFGDQNLQSGVGVTISDDGSGNFTFETNGGSNELFVTNGGGLVANYTTGKVRFDGTFTQVAAGSITLSANQTGGRIYVDVDGTVKQTAGGVLAPPYTVVLALFTTGASTITSLTDHRTFLDQNIIRGLVGDIVTIVPDASAAQGATNRLADAGHTHAIATAAPVSQTPDQANAKGSSTSFARADHVHNVPTAAPITQTPDNANADGSAATFARSDHVHNVPTAAAVTLSAVTTNTQGSTTNFARADHTHAILSGTPSTQTPDQLNAAGSSANFARADHIHNIPTVAPVTQGPDNANADGSSANFSRADHVHNIPTAAAVTLNASSTNTQGSTTNFARADHTHAISSGVVSTQNADQSNAAGSSTNFARADHIHNIPTAVAVDVSSVNSQGTSANFSKADHVHKGMHSFSLFGGTMRFGDVVVKNGNGLTITDNGDNSFTFDTNFGANEFVVTGTSGLQINYTGGRFVNGSNGAVVNVAAGNVTVAANVALGYLYVSINNLGAPSVTASTTPPGVDALAFATYTSGPSTVTTNDIRAFLNVSPVANTLRVTYPGSGLTVFWNSGGVMIQGVHSAIAAGSSTLTANVTLGAIYVDPITEVVTINQTGVFPPGCVPMAQYTTGSATVTALTNYRTFTNVSMVPGLSGDIVTIVPDASIVAGSTNKYADAGHTHAIATAAPITQGPDNANAKGTSTSFARADHVHNIPSAAAVSQTTDQANAVGTSTSFARADHIHNIATGTPSSIGSANAQGSSTTFVRTDHVHQGIHSLKANAGGTQRFGDLVFLAGTGLSITDDGAGDFTWQASLADYGNGSDGNVTISVNTTLTRSMFYNNLTINNSVTLTTGGFKIFVAGTLTNNGTIDDSGGNGGTGGNAVSGGAVGAAGAAGTAATNGELGGGVAGGAGGAGGSAGVGGAGGAGTASNPSQSGGNGGSGGVGAAAGSTGGAAGTGGTATNHAFEALTTNLYSTTNSGGIFWLIVLLGGAGGGGGGGGGATGGTSRGGGGGGGGGSGGVIMIYAKTFDNVGTISSNGGNGGNGGNGAGTQGGGGSGGGGGGGGALYLVYDTLTALGTVEVNGGGAGSGGTGTGTASTGVSGNAGANGLITKFNALTRTWS